MSRIGKQPIPVPSGVTVDLKGQSVSVKGPKGELHQFIPAHVDVALEGNTVVVTRHNDAKPSRANHGLTRALIANMVHGVSKGFEKKLEILGVGYRAEVKGSNLVMNLGYSHQVEYPIPQGIQITVDKTTKLVVLGIDKQQVGQVAAKIRSFRPPDSYKGKGVRYVDEHVRLKAGKSA